MLFWKALRGLGLVFRCHQCNASWERPAAAVTHERSFPPPWFPRRPEPECGCHGAVGLHGRAELPVAGDVQLATLPAQEPLPPRHVRLPHQRARLLRRRAGEAPAPVGPGNQCTVTWWFPKTPGPITALLQLAHIDGWMFTAFDPKGNFLPLQRE